MSPAGMVKSSIINLKLLRRLPDGSGALPGKCFNPYFPVSYVVIIFLRHRVQDPFFLVSAGASFTSWSLAAPQFLHFPGLQRASTSAPHTAHFQSAIKFTPLKRPFSIPARLQPDLYCRKLPNRLPAHRLRLLQQPRLCCC